MKNKINLIIKPHYRNNGFIFLNYKRIKEILPFVYKIDYNLEMIDIDKSSLYIYEKYKEKTDFIVIYYKYGFAVINLLDKSKHGSPLVNIYNVFGCAVLFYNKSKKSFLRKVNVFSLSINYNSKNKEVYSFKDEPYFIEKHDLSIFNISGLTFWNKYRFSLIRLEKLNKFIKKIHKKG